VWRFEGSRAGYDGVLLSGASWSLLVVSNVTSSPMMIRKGSKAGSRLRKLARTISNQQSNTTLRESEQAVRSATERTNETQPQQQYLLFTSYY